MEYPSASPRAKPQLNVSGQVKTYVLDTNVLLHDPRSIFRFEDNNLAIPVEVLEELDGIHERLRTMLAAEGASVDAIEVCPHRPEDAWAHVAPPLCSDSRRRRPNSATAALSSMQRRSAG